MGMSVSEVISAVGGVASWRTLRRYCSRSQIDRAVRSGDAVRPARGRYTLPEASAGAKAAATYAGVMSHRTAAAHWGWAMKTTSRVPDITVPKHRRLQRFHEKRVVIHRTDLTPDEIDGFVTTKDRTLVDCLRTLPFDEALAIADSAVRAGDVCASRLKSLAGRVRGPGSAHVRRVAAHVDGKAANPFESVLRAIAIDEGMRVRAQVTVRGKHQDARPDLVDEDLQYALEADSFEWHGSRQALRADARRYNDLLLAGWPPLRFSYEDVMHDQAYVRQVFRDVATSWLSGRCRMCGDTVHAGAHSPAPASP